MDVTCFETTTIGVAQSLHSMRSMMPSLLSLLNSAVTLCFNANGTGRALQKIGLASSRNLTCALNPCMGSLPF